MSGTVVPVTAMGQVRGAAWTRVPAAAAAALGAGAPLVCAPAAAAAGWWSVAGVVLAGLVALLTAVSLADLAAQSCLTGVSAHVRTRLGVLPGRMAGVLDIGGRVVGAAAVAGTAGAYLAPSQPKVAAVGVVVVVAALALGRVAFSAPSRWVIAGVTIVTLAVFVTTGLAIEPVQQAVAATAGTPGSDDPTGVIAAAGLFAFGFLGVERAVGTRARVGIVAVVVVAVGYLLVCVAALRQLGGPRLGLSPTPLRDALAAADGAAIDPMLTAGILVGALLAVRTLLSGAGAGLTDLVEAGELPAAAATRRHLITAVAASAVALMVDPATAVAIAATLLLGAAAFLNSAARTLARPQRSSWVPTGCCGLALSVVVGVNISTGSLLAAVVVLFIGVGLCTLRVRRAAVADPPE
ncbi:amino acid/polyamine/organocation transporter (APC superfamily) [Actinokineospora cianjurensis]|uniref:Amino acid/polyamine/organocation transporter (APC superfamily) n=1 Tax=Actinokineospora cianjurensis TaxID=585224 RepID=A0A421AZR1_9PSEU|nr:amino acid/polyamine/organocation transporter (APC superfamily) [Actinokineospora cianjurensis]